MTARKDGGCVLRLVELPRAGSPTRRRSGKRTPAWLTKPVIMLTCSRHGVPPLRLVLYSSD
jgi:hypothetical protein